jgi:type IV secretory pathway VirB9-like protein
MKKTLLTTTMLLSLSAGVQAQNACELVAYTPENSYDIQSSRTAAAHIKFPAEIVTTNNSLAKAFDVRYDGRDVWIRGKSDNEQINNAGISVKLSNDETVYLNVVVQDVKGPCYTFVQREHVLSALNQEPDLKAKALELDTARTQALNEAENYKIKARQLRSTYTTALERSQQQQALIAADALEAFKKNINTGYAVSSSKPADPYVEAAYDDGLFTYIRINTSSFGVPTLVKRADEETQVAQYDFNDQTGVYTVQGLHNHLALTLGDILIEIERKN